MRVLLIDVNCKYSSTGKIVYNLFNALKAEGHEAAVCYGRGEKIDEEGIYKFGIDAETYFHAFMTRMTGLTGMLFSPFSTRRLLKYIKNYKPDVVHIHELHAYFVNIKPVIDYLKAQGIKTVWTFHCEFMYTGKCGHANECENWKTECHQCPQLKEYPKSLVFDFVRLMQRQKKAMFEGFDHLTIITPSLWLKKRVEESFLKHVQLDVIHNGLDTEDTFYPREVSRLKEKLQLNNEKVVLAVAPDIMSIRKGGPWVLELANRFVNQPVKFIFVGVNGDELKTENNIIAVQRTSNQSELAEYYSLADVFVICSERENFPTTCLEALSCGTPICGFDVGGTAETASVEHGSFVEYGDMDALFKVVNERLFSPEEFSEREAHVKYAKASYAMEIMYRKYLNLYKS